MTSSLITKDFRGYFGDCHIYHQVYFVVIGRMGRKTLKASFIVSFPDQRRVDILVTSEYVMVKRFLSHVCNECRVLIFHLRRMSVVVFCVFEWVVAQFYNITRFFKGVLGIRFGSLESEKIIIGSLESKEIGSLQVYTGYLTSSLKKTPDITERFESTRRNGSYYTLVIEDTEADEGRGRVIGTGTLEIEEKFIHSCALVKRNVLIALGTHVLLCDLVLRLAYRFSRSIEWDITLFSSVLSV